MGSLAPGAPNFNREVRSLGAAVAELKRLSNRNGNPKLEYPRTGVDVTVTLVWAQVF